MKPLSSCKGRSATLCIALGTFIAFQGCRSDRGAIHSKVESAPNSIRAQSSRSRLNELIPEVRAYEDLRYYRDPEDARKRRR